VIDTLLRAAGLAAIYLLVLTSVKPGDVALAALLGIGISLAVRPQDERPPTPGFNPIAAVVVLGRTAVEVVAGSWRTVRFCLGARYRSGFVEIPRAGRSRHNVALWGVLTGEAPDEVTIDVDVERDVLIVHLVDATDPDAVRARHAQQTGAQRKWVP
jgi:multisubunit Na+/H+ antiporter MnhE subunit